MRPAHSPGIGTILFGLLLLAALYGGAYLLTMRQSSTVGPYPLAALPAIGHRQAIRYSFPEYSHPALEPFFRPAHRIDRLVRPRIWQPWPLPYKIIELQTGSALILPPEEPGK